MSSIRSTWVAAAAGVVALGLATSAAAQAPAEATTISVAPRVLVAAPQKSPVDFPGVAKARAGQPLPSGYVAVGRDVKIARGSEVAFAAMRMTCPKGKTWRTGASAGDVGLSVLDRRVTGKRSVLVLATPAPSVQQGKTATGTVYSLCR